MGKVTERDLAYIAAFVDAEGTVGLSKIHDTKYRAPTLDIPNTERSILDWIVTRFPKGAAISSKKIYQEHHTPSYCLSYRYDAALYVLEKIIPYMKHSKKKARAQYLLDNYKRVTLRNGRYNEEEKITKLDFERGFFAIA